MRLKFKKPWKYSPHGYDVVECAAGSESEVRDDLAEIAIDEGFAEKVKPSASRGTAPRAPAAPGASRRSAGKPSAASDAESGGEGE